MSVYRRIALFVVLTAGLGLALLPGAEVAQAAAPTIESVAITSTPTIDADQDGTADTYGVGENLEVTVTWNQNVSWDVSATNAVITMNFNVGGTRLARLVTGGATSGTSQSLVFRKQVSSSYTDTDGFTLVVSNMNVVFLNNGATIRNAGSEDASLACTSPCMLPVADANHKVDGSRSPDTAAPALQSATVEGAELALTYDEALSGSAPNAGAFTVTVAGSSRSVNSVALSGKALTLTLASAVTSGQTVTVSYIAVNAGGNPVQDAAGNQAVDLTNQAVTNNTDSPPAVSGALSITSSPTTGTTYGAGENIEVTAAFNENVTVTGTPQLEIAVGSNNRQADYNRGSGTASLVFRYTVAAGDEDTDGISVAANKLTLNSGTIKDSDDNDAALTHTALAAQSGHKVDGVAPAVSGALSVSSTPTTGTTYGAGEHVEVTVAFNENVTVTGTPQLEIAVGSNNRQADYNRGSGTASLVFRYTVAAGDEDTDGISVAANKLTLNSGTIKDASGNAATLTHTALAAQSGHEVDGVAPTLQSATVNGASLTLTYDENLDTGSVPAAGDFTVTVDSSERTVSTVMVSEATITLTLASAVLTGQTVTVSYTAGTNPVQDAAGNQAVDLTNQAVTNNTGVLMDVGGPCGNNTCPHAPTGTAVPGPGGGQITVSWTPATTGGSATQWTVYIRKSGTDSYLSTDLPGSVRSHTYSNQEQGVAYDVRVQGNIGGTIFGNRAGANGVVALDTPPSLSGAVVDGTSLTITYDENLDTGSVPAAGDFTVTVAGSERTVSTVEVSEATVTLTLASAVRAAETVTVSYTAGTNPVQDATGNAAANLTNQAVTNNSTPLPRLVSGTINNTYDGSDYTMRAVLHFSKALDATVTPAGSQFTTVLIGGDGREKRPYPSYYRDNAPDSVTVTGNTIILEWEGILLSFDMRMGVRITDRSNIRDLSRNPMAAPTALLELTNISPSDGILDLELKLKPMLAVTGSAVVNGAALTLKFDRILDPADSAAPLPTAFTVSGAAAATTVTSVKIRGASVMLTLSPAVGQTETGVTLSYGKNAPPATRNLRNLWRIDADSFTNQAVTNALGDTTKPTLVAGTANEDTVKLWFSEPLDATAPPQASKMPVSFSLGTVTNVAVAGNVITLTTSLATTQGTVVTIGFLSGFVVQDLAGNQIVRPNSYDLTNITGLAAVNPALAMTDPAVVSGNTLTLTFDLALEPASLPPAAFTVSGAAPEAIVDSVKIDGKTVELTLRASVPAGWKRLTVSYDATQTPGIKSLTGGSAAAFTGQAVTVSGTDVVAPKLRCGIPDYRNRRFRFDFGQTLPPGYNVLTCGEAVGTTLTLKFDEMLETSAPPVSAFAVYRQVHGYHVPGEMPTAVNINGKVVTLTLPKKVTGGTDRLDLWYEKPATNPLKDTAGNQVPKFHYPIHVPDVTPPTLVAGRIDGTAVTLGYSEPLARTTPAASHFTLAGANLGAISNVAVDGTAITFTTATAATASQTITVTVSESSEIRDPALNQATPVTTAVTLKNAASSGDPGAPALVAKTMATDPAVVDGGLVTLTYDKDLDPASVPPRRAFTAYYPGHSVDIVAIDGAKVLLTLGAPVWPCDGSFKLEYDNAFTPKIQNLWGTAAPGFTGEDNAVTVTNDRADDCGTEGMVGGMSANGSSLTLSFNEPLDTTREEPDPSGFEVEGDSASGADAPTVEEVGFSSANAIVLTLSRSVAPEETVTVSHSRPKTGNVLWQANGDQVQYFSTAPDSAAPTVTGVAVVSDAGPDDTYGSGDMIRVRLAFGEAVDVSGTPRLQIKMDPAYGEKWAVYESGSGTAALVFAFGPVAEPNFSPQGIAVLADTLELNGGAIASQATGVAAALDHAGLDHDPAHKVDHAPPPTLSVGNARAEEGGTLVFTVRLSESAGAAVTVDYATSDGAATEGQDYTAASGTLTFAAGVLEQAVEVAALTDRAEEGDETFTVSLSNPSGATLADGEAAGTVVNVAPPPPVVSVADARADEGGTLVFTVRLSEAADAAVTVDYATSDGTATAGEDYTAAAGTLTFAAGVLEQTVEVAALEDRTDEGDETFTVSLSNPSGATLADGEATGTVANVAPPLPAVTGVAIASDPGPDDTYRLGDMIRVRLAFDEAVDVSGTPRLQIKMDPAYGEKWAVYESGSGTAALVFAFGPVAEPNFSDQGIAVLADTLELNGGAIVSQATGTAAALDHAGLDHDPAHKVDHAAAPPTLSAADARADEGGTLVFTVRLSEASGAAVTVDYATSDGTAAAGQDYAASAGTLTFAAGEVEQTVEVAALEDRTEEGDETFTVSLSNPSGATLADGERGPAERSAGVQPRKLQLLDTGVGLV